MIKNNKIGVSIIDIVGNFIYIDSQASKQFETKQNKNKKTNIH